MSVYSKWKSEQQGAETVLAMMQKAKQYDLDWYDLKNLTASYFGGHDVAQLAKEAFCLHIGDNVIHKHGLHPSVAR